MTSSCLPSLLSALLAFSFLALRARQSTLDMFGFIAIIVGSIISRLAPASLICQWSRRTFSLIVQSINRTLYYICLINRVFCKQFASVRIVLVTSEYFTAVVEALDKVSTKVSHEEGRLLISSIALRSSSMVVPRAEIWELRLSYSFRCV